MKFEWQFAGNQGRLAIESSGGVHFQAVVCENQMLVAAFSAVVFRCDKHRVKALGSFSSLDNATNACERAILRGTEFFEEVA